MTYSTDSLSFKGAGLLTLQIQQNLHNAVQRVLRDDSFLLKYDVHEQTLSHRIAVYLESMFPEHHVDCEYNNDLDSQSGRKQVQYPNNDEVSIVRPDIIVHHRGRNGRHHNLLIIELKKSTSTKSDIEGDRIKLCEFTALGKIQHYGYQCGALLILGVKENAGESRIEWFEKGNSID